MNIKNLYNALSVRSGQNINILKGFSRRELRFTYFLCTGIMLLAFILTLMASTHNNFPPDKKIYLILSNIACIAGIVCCFIMPLFVIRAKQDRLSGENILYENKERYRSIIAASNTGAWEYHSDTQYQWYSSEYFKMLGYDINEFLEDNELTIKSIWMTLLHPDDRATASECFANYIRNGSSDMYENYFRLKHKNGKWVWIWSRGQTLKKPDGTMSTITLGTHIDISEKKNMEIELVKYNKKLLKYAHLNAHEVRGPVARILGLIGLTKLTSDIDYSWLFEKVQKEANDIDKILKIVTKELNEIEEHQLLHKISNDLNEEC